MNEEADRNLGVQPISGILKEHNLTPHDLVKASTEHITHKMVKRAAKGRWCTKNTRMKVCNALNAASGKDYAVKELFTY